MARSDGSVIGSWAFLIGVILAVLFGLFGASAGAELGNALVLILVVIGLIVGLLNIADKETTPFLLAGLTLIIASSLGKDVISTVPTLAGVLEALQLIFVPATIIVAIRHVFGLARR